MKTTLNAIRSHSPCEKGWKKLLSHLGKTTADDEPLTITTILDSNGLDDAIWCLRAVSGRDKEIRLFAVWCARQVQHLMTDQRSIAAIDFAERYAHGASSTYELDAAWSAAGAAGDAAWASSRDGSRAAAVAAGDAAWASAWSSEDAAWSAARDAARAAAVAAGDAAWAVAGSSGSAAWSAAGASEAATRAAMAAVMDAQEKRLREICAEIANHEGSAA